MKRIIDQVKESIGRFAILWAEIENKKYNKNCTCIKILQTNIGFSNKHGDEKFNMAQNLKRELKRIVNGGDLNTSLRCRNNDLSRIAQNWLNQSNEDSVDNRAIIAVIYRIRNNMFHGEKFIYSLPNQVRLFDFSSDFMEKLLEES